MNNLSADHAQKLAPVQVFARGRFFNIYFLCFSPESLRGCFSKLLLAAVGKAGSGRNLAAKSAVLLLANRRRHLRFALLHINKREQAAGRGFFCRSVLSAPRCGAAEPFFPEKDVKG